LRGGEVRAESVRVMNGVRCIVGGGGVSTTRKKDKYMTVEGRQEGGVGSRGGRS